MFVLKYAIKNQDFFSQRMTMLTKVATGLILYDACRVPPLPFFTRQRFPEHTGRRARIPIQLFSVDDHTLVKIHIKHYFTKLMGQTGIIAVQSVFASRSEQSQLHSFP